MEKIINHISIEKGVASWLSDDTIKEYDKKSVYSAWGGNSEKGFIRVYDLDKDKLVGIVRFLMEYPRPNRSWILFLVLFFVVLAILGVVLSINSKPPSPTLISSSGSLSLISKESTYSTGVSRYIPPIESSSGFVDFSKENKKISDEIEIYKNTLQVERLKTLNSSQLEDLTDKDNEILDLIQKNEKLKKEIQACDDTIKESVINPYDTIAMKIGTAILDKCKKNELNKEKCSELVLQNFNK